MDAKTYLKKFSHAVRWRLPQSDADEVLADYQEMLSQRFDSLDELPLQELGEPVQAARMLTERKAYHRWLAAFGFLALCLLLPDFLLLQTSFRQYPAVLIYTFFILGTTVSLIWFRPHHGESRKFSLPKGLLPMLLGLWTVIVAAAVIMAGLIMQVWKLLPPEWYGRVAYGTLLSAGTAATIFGLWGLIKARLSDRRWCSLYVMGLAGLSECVLILALLVSPTLGASSSDWLAPYARSLVIIGTAGLIGVGASLC